jgi:hypothetical protein
MRLYINSKLINSDTEQSITSDKFGLSCFVFFPNGVYGDGKPTELLMENLTQVHVNYNLGEDDLRVAFESDIHSGGMWKLCKHISCIHIRRSTKLYADYRR